MENSEKMSELKIVVDSSREKDPNSIFFKNLFQNDSVKFCELSPSLENDDWNSFLRENAFSEEWFSRPPCPADVVIPEFESTSSTLVLFGKEFSSVISCGFSPTSLSFELWFFGQNLRIFGGEQSEGERSESQFFEFSNPFSEYQRKIIEIPFTSKLNFSSSEPVFLVLTNFRVCFSEIRNLKSHSNFPTLQISTGKLIDSTVKIPVSAKYPTNFAEIYFEDAHQRRSVPKSIEFARGCYFVECFEECFEKNLETLLFRWEFNSGLVQLPLVKKFEKIIKPSRHTFSQGMPVFPLSLTLEKNFVEKSGEFREQKKFLVNSVVSSCSVIKGDRVLTIPNQTNFTLQTSMSHLQSFSSVVQSAGWMIGENVDLGMWNSLRKSFSNIPDFVIFPGVEWAIFRDFQSVYSEQNAILRFEVDWAGRGGKTCLKFLYFGKTLIDSSKAEIIVRDLESEEIFLQENLIEFSVRDDDNYHTGNSNPIFSNFIRSKFLNLGKVILPDCEKIMIEFRVTKTQATSQETILMGVSEMKWVSSEISEDPKKLIVSWGEFWDERNGDLNGDQNGDHDENDIDPKSTTFLFATSDRSSTSEIVVEFVSPKTKQIVAEIELSPNVILSSDSKTEKYILSDQQIDRALRENENGEKVLWMVVRGSDEQNSEVHFENLPIFSVLTGKISDQDTEKVMYDHVTFLEKEGVVVGEKIKNVATEAWYHHQFKRILKVVIWVCLVVVVACFGWWIGKWLLD